MADTTTKVTLTEAIRQAVEQLSERLHVSMPGIITSYDRTTKRADVQPAISRRVRGRVKPVKYPIIRNIHVAHPQTSNAIIRMPISVGDYVQIIFYDRAAQNWLDGDGEIREALDVRKHHINDAYCLLGGGPRAGGVYDDPGADDSLIVALADEFIEITVDGDILIGAGATKAAARVDDAVLSNSSTDSAFWTWLVGAFAVIENWIIVPADGGAALQAAMKAYILANPVPGSLTSKVNAGSDNVKIG